MATFPVTGMLEKETNAGAVAKNINAGTVSCDVMGALTGIEAGGIMAYTVVGFSGIGAGVPTSPTTYLTVGPSAVGVSSMRISSGVAPTTPVNGDIWYDGTNLKMRVGSTTKTFTLV